MSAYHVSAHCQQSGLTLRWSLRSCGQQTHLVSHAGHPPAEHLSLLEPVLQLLLPELLLDVRAEWHRTIVLLAVLGMVAAEGNKLFADGASTIGFPFTAFGVQQDLLHLLAGRHRTVGIAALARMHQTLYAALYAQVARGSPPMYGRFCFLVVALLTQANA